MKNAMRTILVSSAITGIQMLSFGQSINKTLAVSTEGIPPGIYYLKAQYKEAVLQKMIIIKR